MEPNSSIIKKLSACLISITAAVCFCGQEVIAQPGTDKPLPSKNVIEQDITKLPTRTPNLSDLSLPKDPPKPPIVPAATVMSETANGFTANVKTPPGLNTIIFTIPGQDTFEVYLPNRLSQGGGFTATIKLLPKDGSNVDAFKNYSLNIDGQRFPLNSGKFDVHLTEWAKESTRVLLVDKDAHLLAGVRLPVSLSQPLPGDSSLPTSATSGGLLQITCPCQGTLGIFDSVKIGGEPMQILASSPGSVVVLNTYNTPGLTVIETNLGGVITKKEFRNLTLKLSADKLKLLKGEETTVHIVVGGLEKLKAPAKMTVVATGVVAMGGGNSQTITIDPSAVAADGTYTTAESLFAMSAGTFGVNVTVTVDEKTP